MYLKNKDIAAQMKQFLEVLPDLDLILIRLSRFQQKLASKASLKDCYSIFLFISSLRGLQAFLNSTQKDKAEEYLFDVISDLLNELKEL